jgi:oxygen-independent coproporphyrinogen-3 oxidase
MFGSRPKIKELHLGGGTPTFFSPENLKILIDGIMAHADYMPGYEFSFEDIQTIPHVHIYKPCLI